MPDRDLFPSISCMSEALKLAASGFAVFPVSNDKTPRTPNGHKAASKAPERIKAMATQIGFVLIGIATGEASDLVVLDIDRQHDGAAWWQANRGRLPATLTHRTRSGGLHLWFRHQHGLRCSAGKIAPGIDTRADGGYIIYWPAAGFPVMLDAPLSAWPAWLVPTPKTLPATSYAVVGRHPAKNIETQLAGLVRTIAAASEGRRNASLFWAASRAAEIVAEGQLSKPHAEAVMLEAANRAGLNHVEAARTIASALSRRAA